MSSFEVRITSGPSESRAIRIGNEPIVFGRTDAADVVLSRDHSTSSRHFQLNVADGKLLLQDLGSKNGTSVNGQRVDACQLNPGDQIQAGFTSLAVHRLADTPFESSAGHPAQKNVFNPFGSYYAPPKNSAGSDSGGAVAEKEKESATLPVTRSEGGGETVCLTGRIPEGYSIADILERLTQLGSFYWIIDFTRFAAPIPDGLDLQVGCLFPWLPECAFGLAPQLFGLEELPNWKPFVEEGWGQDGIIALVSDSDKSSIVAELRRLVRDPSLPGRSRGINGYCWPAVLTAMLENDSGGFAQPFLDIVKLAIVETPDAGGWRLFTRDAILPQVEQQGVSIANDSQQTRST